MISQKKNVHQLIESYLPTPQKVPIVLPITSKSVDRFADHFKKVAIVEKNVEHSQKPDRCRNRASDASKTQKNNAFAAVMECFQKVFVCNFAQAHLLTTLKKKNTVNVDSRNCASDVSKKRKSNAFAGSWAWLQKLFVCYFS